MFLPRASVNCVSVYLLLLKGADDQMGRDELTSRFQGNALTLTNSEELT